MTGQSTDSTLLSIDNLHTQFQTRNGLVRAVEGVSMTVDQGEIVGLVGESGSGKSVTARSIVGLQDPGEIVRGSIHLDDVAVTDATDRQLRRLRGDTVSMVFQDPTETLNPVFDVGEQIAESIKVHEEPGPQRLLEYLHLPPFSSRSEWREYRERAIDLMEQVGIASPADRVDAYPHELSGGQRQRAGVAIALASDPDLVIADEPTTALDATTQAQLLERFRQYNAERGTAILLITHDLGVVAEICDRVVVMYAGEVMETGPTERILEDPRHPYTKALLECLPQRVDRESRLPAIDGSVPEPTADRAGCPFAPRCEYATAACRDGEVPTVALADGRGSVTCVESNWSESDTPSSSRGAPDARSESTAAAESAPGDSDRPSPIVELEGVSRHYSLASGLIERLLGADDTLRAVDGVDLEIRAGETLALVGESGCGKSTLASLITGLERPTAGTVRIDGTPVGSVADRDADTLTDVGVVFQDPHSSLNPRLTVEQTIGEPLRSVGWDRPRRKDRVRELLDRVGLSEHQATSYPHELSGGQIQRVAIARAIALDPSLVVLDEPVSALDASVQARLLNVLADLQADLGLAYLFISHDLTVVEHVADRVAVMYLGELMEVGPADRVFDRPTHPYTTALLEAIPSLEPGGSMGASIADAPPNPTDPPSGCVFRTRCPMAEPKCAATDPEQHQLEAGRSKCHFARDH